MDPHSIADKGTSQESPAADSPQRGWPGVPADEPPASGEVRFPGEDGGKSLAEMAQKDLTATLQLLAERAQYITGATGAAIALRDRAEMVCRASAGSSAPEVGARLQVNSGLSGESIRTRQTLRCDDAATDSRVNRESCEALGIASVVVMPLVHADEVIGVFELFSDKAHIFEARDITALERMGTMVFTALEQAAAAQGFSSEEKGAPVEPGMAVSDTLEGRPLSQPRRETQPTTEPEPPQNGNTAQSVDLESVNEVEPEPQTPMRPSGIVFHHRAPVAVAPSAAMSVRPTVEVPPEPVTARVEDEDILEEVEQAVPIPARVMTPVLEKMGSVVSASPIGTPAAALNQELDGEVLEVPPSLQAASPDLRAAVEEPLTTEPAPAPAPSRSAVANLRKCEACGFPVSEGRQLCLDCEKKKPQGGNVPGTGAGPGSTTSGRSERLESPSALASIASVPDDGPQFLAGEEQEPSWIASHKYMVGAVVIALVGIVVLLLAR